MPSSLRRFVRFTTVGALVAVVSLAASALFLLLGPQSGVQAAGDSLTATSRATTSVPATGGACFNMNGGEHDCDPPKASPTIATTPSAGGVVGVVTMNDTATLSGGNSPTGSVTFKLFPPADATCAGAATFTYVDPTAPYATVGGPVANIVGTWHWTASYAGNANNNAASSPCGEPVVVTKATPTIATTPSAGGVVGVVTMNDTATLSGGNSPTGSVTFKLFPPADATCAGAATFTYVDPTAPYATVGGPVANIVGTWHWTANYAGDANNNAASSPCGEPVVVTAPACQQISIIASTTGGNQQQGDDDCDDDGECHESNIILSTTGGNDQQGDDDCDDDGECHESNIILSMTGGNDQQGDDDCDDDGECHESNIILSMTGGNDQQDDDDCDDDGECHESNIINGMTGGNHQQDDDDCDDDGECHESNIINGMTGGNHQQDDDDCDDDDDCVGAQGGQHGGNGCNPGPTPAPFTVSKDFSDNNTANVNVTLSCTSGVVTTVDGTASEADPADFTVAGALPGATCTATENPVPVGYTSTGTCAETLLEGTCSISNTLIGQPGKASPTISTTPTPASGTVNITALNDTALLAGGNGPTGNVTFKLFPPADATCAGAATFTYVDAAAPYATVGGPVAAIVGTYHWTADYAGDANNNPATSPCSEEPVVISEVGQGCTSNCGGGGEIGCTVNCDSVTTSSESPPSGGGGGGTTFLPPAPQVLGSSALITKTRTSDDPATVGETVTFKLSLTITGDTTVTDVTLVDTFENKYLGVTGTLPAGCTVTVASPDLAHNTIRCAIGTVTPGTAGAPGSKTFDYTFSMLALAPTAPSRTLNEARATFDPDAAGPAGPVTIGPAPANVQIVDVSKILLPPTGDGSMSAGVAGVASALGIGLVIALAAARYARRPGSGLR